MSKAASEQYEEDEEKIDDPSLKKRTKTAAQRSREYRQRRDAALFPVIVNIWKDQVTGKKPSSAENSNDDRVDEGENQPSLLHRHLDEQSSADEEEVGDQIDGNSENEFSRSKSKKRSKSAVDRCREYKARKRALRDAANDNSMAAESSASASAHDDEYSVDLTPSDEMSKDNQVDARYSQTSLLYERLNRPNSVEVGEKLAVHPVKVSYGQKSKKQTKSVAERCREYRARKKALRNAPNGNSMTAGSSENLRDDRVDGRRNESSVLRDHLDRQSSPDEQTFAEQADVHLGNVSSPSQSKKQAKTQAERCREYRARKRALRDAAKQNSITAGSSAGASKPVDVRTVDRPPIEKNPENHRVEGRQNRHPRLYECLTDKRQAVHQQDSLFLSEDSSTSAGHVLSSGQNLTALGQDGQIADPLIERAVEQAARRWAFKNVYHFVIDGPNIRRVVPPPPPKIKKAKTAAERSREYRARQRAYKSARERLSSSDTSSDVQYNDNAATNRESSTLNPQLGMTRQKSANNPTDSPTSSIANNGINHTPDIVSWVPCNQYRLHNDLEPEIKIELTDDPCQNSCSVCERLCSVSDLNSPSAEDKGILTEILPDISIDRIFVCNACMASLQETDTTTLSTQIEIKDEPYPTDIDVKYEAMPTDIGIQHEQIPIEIDIEHEQMPIDTDVKREQVPTDTEVSYEPMQIDSDIEYEQLPADIDIEYEQMPAEIDVKYEQMPTEIDIKDEQLPTEIDVKDEQVPIDIDIKYDLIPTQSFAQSRGSRHVNNNQLGIHGQMADASVWADRIAKRSRKHVKASRPIDAHKKRKKRDKTQASRVALARYTSIEGSLLAKNPNDLSFYHGGRGTIDMARLPDEFRRLSKNRLEIMNKRIIDFINRRSGLSAYNLDSQGLRAHSTEPTDALERKSNVVMLTETLSNDDEDLSMPNVNCVIKYKLPNVKTRGQSICHKQYDTVNISTPYIDMTVMQSHRVSSSSTPVGDICVAECQTLDGKTIAIAAIYVAKNQKLADVIYFIHSNLLIYSLASGPLVGRGDDKKPLILRGHFNVDFASNDSLPIVKFLHENFNLQNHNYPNDATIKSAITGDTIFSRYLDTVEAQTFVSYLRFEKPTVSTLSIEEVADDSILIE